jgi:3-hydroxyisobutyrate dehydrogenase
MLPSHPHVNEVFTSKNGILSSVQKSTLCIDCSTIDIEVAKRIANLCDEKTVSFNDAPGKKEINSIKGHFDHIS